MIYRYAVSVKRYVTNGQDPSGATKPKLTTIIANLKCDLQPDKGVIVVPQQGQTAIYYKNMFCDLVDIKANDIITDLSNNETFKVINTNPYTILKHLEVRLQGGTL